MIAWKTLLSVVSGAIVATGIGCDTEKVTSPGVGLEIHNTVDNFQYQVTDVRDYTHVDSFTWQNSGSTATVNQATTVTGGSVTLVLMDAAGVEVYSRSLTENGTFASSAGVAGAWTVRLTYSHASATVNFRVQKAT